MDTALTDGRKRRSGVACFGLSLALCLAALAGGSAVAQDASGMKLVGADPLQGRSAYQLVPHMQGGRWLLYVGHMPGRALNPLTGRTEVNGLSILDVTDPKHPVFLHHEPPAEAPWRRPSDEVSGSYHIQSWDGSALPHGDPSKVYLLRTVGELGDEVLDVTDPRHPRQVSVVLHAETPEAHTGLTGLDGGPHTHKNVWDCASGVAYMPASVAGWKTVFTLRIFDLGDPAKPRWIRDFGLAGQQPGSSVPSRGMGVHEAVPAGDKLYVAYSPFTDGTFQILDLKKVLSGDPKSADPLAATDENLRYPQIGRLDLPSYWGAHTARPMFGMPIPEYAQDKAGKTRDIAVMLSEGVNVRCSVPRDVTFFVDITDPVHPLPISTFQMKAQPGDYCSRLVDFGPHNINASAPPTYDKKLLFLTYFAAGVRVIDIRDPFAPVEVGHYVPAPSGATFYLQDKGPFAGTQFENVPQTNDVAVDSRGLIYIGDRARTGLHILSLTGEPARIAGLKNGGAP
jgi:hypothetical protein